MSLVTRCTSCGTLFKVVADQLKISDGWVRCGQCSCVFDAQSNLVEALKPATQNMPLTPSITLPAPVPSPTAHSASDSDSIRESVLDAKDTEALLAAFASVGVVITPPDRPASSRPGLAPQADDDSFSFSEFAPVLQAPASSRSQPAALDRSKSKASEAEPEPEPEPSYLEAPSFLPGDLRNRNELHSDAGPSSSSWTASEYPVRAAPADGDIFDSQPPALLTLPGEGQTSIEANTQQAMPEFVQQAQRAARWRSPWVRFGLGMLALLLLAGLAIQLALHDKDRIAAQWPDTRPWLTKLCEHAGCRVQAFKRIEAITVDASSFNRINNNNPQLETITHSYRLGVTLKNIDAVPVALPHVELSLQDAQDQPILRRVLSPADLGSALETLAPSQDMAGNLTLQISTTDLANRRIQGYRVLAFYP